MCVCVCSTHTLLTNSVTDIRRLYTPLEYHQTYYLPILPPRITYYRLPLILLHTDARGVSPIFPVHTYTHTCIHTYIHTYVHTYMHACIRTYTHTCTHRYVAVLYITLHLAKHFGGGHVCRSRHRWAIYHPRRVYLCA
jgi:hypothetical protein